MTRQDWPGSQTLKHTEDDDLNQDSCGWGTNEAKWGRGRAGGATWQRHKGHYTHSSHFADIFFFWEFQSFQQAWIMWCRRPPEAARTQLWQPLVSLIRQGCLPVVRSASVLCTRSIWSILFSSLTRGLSQTFPMLMPQLWLGSSRWAEEQQAKWLLPKLLPSWSHYDLHSGN